MGCRATLTAQCGPVAGGVQPRFGHAQAKLVQAPFGGAGRPAPVDSFDLDPPQRTAAHVEVVDRNVQRGHAGGLGQQLLHFGGRRRRQRKPREPGIDAADRTTGQLAHLHIAVEFVGVDVGAPLAAFARAAHHHAVEGAPLRRDPVGANGHGCGQVAQRGARRAARGRARGRCRCGSGPHVHTSGRRKDPLPGVDVDAVQQHVGAHALVRQRCGVAIGEPHRDAAAQHAWFAGGQVAFILHGEHGREQRAELDRQLVAARVVAGHVEHRVVVAQRQAALGRLAQRRWQVQRHALQAAGQLHFGLAAFEAELQRVAGAAAGVLEQARDKAQSGVAQTLGACFALASELHTLHALCIGPRAAFKTHFASQQPGLRRAHREAFFAERQGAAGAPEQGRFRRHLQVVAVELHAAADLGGPGVVQRQLEAEAQLRGAADARARQRLAGHGVDR